MKLIWILFLNLFFLNQLLAKSIFLSPLRFDWTQSFYTDDSSYYLTLYPNGFDQIFRVDREACDQIENMDLVFKDSLLAHQIKTQFSQLKQKSPIYHYGVKESNYCWYKLEARGLSLNSTKSIKYVVKIQDKLSKSEFYFKGITNSLLPFYRLTDSDKIDSWIELGNFGATPVVGGGVYYKIWEPLSQEVHLFLNSNSALKMNAEFALNDERRFHFLYVPNSKIGDLYHFQFVKNGQYEVLEIANFKSMSAIKIDPMARELVYDHKGGLYNGFINPRGVVSQDHDPIEYLWKNDEKMSQISALDYNNWIIYQLWPLTFNPKEVNGAFVQGQFSDVTNKISYLNDLGVNAVEFLPVNLSRFNASWGYALDSLIIIEDTLGTKGQLKGLVDQLHNSQIRVLFDVVINHVNNNLLREPLSATENSSKFYSGDTPWGPKPRFESVWVRKWIADSLIHMRREFHVDGYRFDMTDAIFNDSKGGYRFLQELNYLLKLDNDNFYLSAEQLPDDVWVTYPLSENGLGFDSQWNDRFKNFFELEFDKYTKEKKQVDLFFLSESLKGYSDHEMSPHNYYNFGDPNRTVNYLGSHDFVGNKNPFIRIVSEYISTETIDHNIVSRVNPLEEKGDLQTPFRTIHNYFSHAATRLAYGILFTKPGASLFYQGEEFAQDLNLENEWSYMNATDGNRFPSQDVNIDKYIRSHRTPWYYYELAYGKKIPQLNFATQNEMQLFKGHFDFFKDMISFKKQNPEINNSEAFNVQYDSFSNIITYEIKTEKKWFFIVANFREDSGGSWISFPGNSNHWWREILNSSLSQYGGENNIHRNIISNLGGRQNLLRLKGPGFYIFQAESLPVVQQELFLRGNFNNWKAEQNLLLSKTNDEELIVYFEIKNDQLIEFKLASEDWQIDLGVAPAKPFKFLEVELGEARPTNSGFLTYVPLSANVKHYLNKGKYSLKFNIRNFIYNIEKRN